MRPSNHRLRTKAILAATVASSLMIGGASARAAVPGNDLYQDAIRMPGFPSTITGNNAEATSTRTDPRCGEDPRTVWYRFTPSEDVEIGARVRAGFDATLHVVTGTPGQWNIVGCADDPPAVRFRARAGRTYLFMVASYSGPGGPFTLALERPALPKLGLVIARTVVREDTGDVMVQGRVTCVRTRRVTIGSVELRQRRADDTLATGGSAMPPGKIACDRDGTGWRTLVIPWNLAFDPGPARAGIVIRACTVWGCTTKRFEPVVELVPAT